MSWESTLELPENASYADAVRAYCTAVRQEELDPADPNDDRVRELQTALNEATKYFFPNYTG